MSTIDIPANVNYNNNAYSSIRLTGDPMTTIFLAHLIQSIGPQLFLFALLYTIASARNPKSGASTEEFQNFASQRTFSYPARPSPTTEKASSYSENYFYPETESTKPQDSFKSSAYSSRPSDSSGTPNNSSRPSGEQTQFRSSSSDADEAAPSTASGSIEATADLLEFLNDGRTGIKAESGNAFAILGVEQNANEKTIKAALKAAQLKYHPDKNDDQRAQRAFALIQEAGTKAMYVSRPA